ncbi:MAG TPA: hypothetical protein ENI26_06610 [Methylophaga aminisulfidivorans]|uniref:Glutathione metabolism protein n=2 Tax=root TaxID=1 RepID=A0A7C2AH25_9GAMM|nr:hypothetical protein [Methylophaga aminisulfidivorans]
MITALYASLCALLLVKLSLNVIKVRRQFRVRLGDGNHDVLTAAIRAQGNANEYIPITLILMFTLESMAVSSWLIHIAGITLLIGRLCHASALKQDNIQRRAVAMRITLFLIIILALLNMVFLAWGYFHGY